MILGLLAFASVLASLLAGFTRKGATALGMAACGLVLLIQVALTFLA